MIASHYSTDLQVAVKTQDTQEPSNKMQGRRDLTLQHKQKKFALQMFSEEKKRIQHVDEAFGIYIIALWWVITECKHMLCLF